MRGVPGCPFAGVVPCSSIAKPVANSARPRIACLAVAPSSHGLVSHIAGHMPDAPRGALATVLCLLLPSPGCTSIAMLAMHATTVARSEAGTGERSRRITVAKGSSHPRHQRDWALLKPLVWRNFCSVHSRRRPISARQPQAGARWLRVQIAAASPIPSASLVLALPDLRVSPTALRRPPP